MSIEKPPSNRSSFGVVFLCRIKVSHPATQLFHGLYFIVSYVDILNRTKLSREVGSIPRLVSIDKYNFIVNHLVENVDIIEIVLF